MRTFCVARSRHRKGGAGLAERKRRAEINSRMIYFRIGTIQRIALGGDVSSVGNDAAQLAFVGAVAHRGETTFSSIKMLPTFIGAKLQAQPGKL